MAREEAMEAQKRKERENKITVEKMKALSDIRLDELEEEKKEEFIKRKEIVEAV